MDTLPRPFGPFLLLKSLGSGATGDVFIARPLDPNSGWPTPIVVKRMHRALTAQPEQHARFHHEARIALALSTPHVPRIHTVGEADGTSYIAMDFVPGWTLSRIIRGRTRGDPRVSVASLVDIVRGTLNGLIALHEAKDPGTGRPLEALHRDLAPKNIMLGEDGVTRLIDLGLGKSTVQEWQTMTGVIMGTPGYMAPEQVYADRVDVRADLYTVGVVLWELLAEESYIPRGPIHGMLRQQAQAPFRAPPPRPGVPGAMNDVLARALALAPPDRFDSAREFLAAVETASTGLPAGRGPVAELVTTEMWDELAADQDEVLDLTQAMEAPVALIEQTDRMNVGGGFSEADSYAQTVAREPVSADTLADDHATRPDDPAATTMDPPAVHLSDGPIAIPIPTMQSPAKVLPAAQVGRPAAVTAAPSAPRRPAADAEPTEAVELPADAFVGAMGKAAAKGSESELSSGRNLLLGLAIAAVGTVIGIGGVISFRVLTEEPAPQRVTRPARTPRATPAEDGARGPRAASDRIGRLLQRVRNLEGRYPTKSRNARKVSELRRAFEAAARAGTVGDDRLAAWEATLVTLERRAR